MSDLEEEGVPSGPRNKSHQKKRQGNRNNRNTTLLIPDVVPLKNRLKGDSTSPHPISGNKSQCPNNQSLDKNSSDNGYSTPQNTP